MSKTPLDNVPTPDADLLPEYEFDYSQAKPNRFAQRDLRQPQIVVVLDDDVARVFKTPESVNQVLRALIQSMSQIING